MTNQILTKKLELIQWLSTIESKTVLDKISEIKENDTIELSLKLSQNEIESINLGLEDLEKGKIKPHDKVKKIYEKWL